MCLTRQSPQWDALSAVISSHLPAWPLLQSEMPSQLVSNNNACPHKGWPVMETQRNQTHHLKHLFWLVQANVLATLWARRLEKKKEGCFLRSPRCESSESFAVLQCVCLWVLCSDAVLIPLPPYICLGYRTVGSGQGLNWVRLTQMEKRKSHWVNILWVTS